jgi:signal transduction histidine kinase
MRFDSIWTRLVVGLVGAAFLAVLAAAAGLYIRFKATNDSFREATLQSEARLITRLVQRATSDEGLRRAIDEILRLQKADAVYAISDAEGRIIAASSGVTKPIWATDSDKKEEFFVRAGHGGNAPLYGITISAAYNRQPVYVQVAYAQPEIFFDSVLAEFLVDIAWIWIPFVVGLVALNLFIVKRAIRPLQRVVAQAEAIRPHNSNQLLDEDGLPSEVQSLVASMNRAFRRMNSALDTQANFIADASHELRTPIAVLKAHTDILPQTEGIATIRGEVDALARLVEQLLDSARLDAMNTDAREVVDLCDLAHEVACHLAPSALLADKKIELTTEAPHIRVTGQHTYLFRALRNVVENGLHHTPAGTAVVVDVRGPGTITVTDCGPGIPDEIRERIFQKFWQGGRDRTKGGAGLGMDIVRRTMAAMHGQVVIGSASHGGAIVTLQLPAASA